ncbi:MAG: hypothetical protein K2M15_10150 [Oscillospiraceae bacterium]|nr:hypothetical protein [Oscillospiraceae bacterium]MDE7170784.1 hypothetical protein [Oscillospiraceae bacterium]
MNIVVSILAILFGALHIIAAVTQFKSKDPAARGLAISMASGGIAAILSAAFHLYWGAVGGNSNLSDATTLAIGSLMICFAAYINGRRAGNLHLSHHIVRGTIAALLVAGFVIW